MLYTHIDFFEKLWEDGDMFTNALPAPLNISLCAGVPTTFEFEVLNVRGEPKEMSFYTYAGVAESNDGTRYELTGRVEGSAPSVVLLDFPALPTGSYKYEVHVTSDTGEVAVLVVGVLGVAWPDLTDAAPKTEPRSPNRRVVVKVPENGQTCVAQWAITGFIEAKLVGLNTSVESAKEYAEESKKQAQTAADQAGRLEKVEAFLAVFEDKITSAVVVDSETGHLIIGGVDTMVKVSGDPGKSPYIAEDGRWRYYDDATQQWLIGPPARGEAGRSPYINSLGTWTEWDPVLGRWKDTGCQAQGKDGVDGTTARRILVNRVEDIPKEGETCSGGYLYYVPLSDALPVALLTVLSAGRTEADRLFVNGQEIALPPASYEPEEAAIELALSFQEAFPEAEVSVTGATVALRADVLGWSFSSLNEDGYDLVQHVRMERSGYDVYGWLETPDGAAGWELVDDVDDIATTEVFGISRRGTDKVVAEGAPVGHNEHGQMSVPLAEYTVPGSAMRGVDFVIERGGGVGLDSEGRMFCRMATVDFLGAVKPSFSGSNLASVVGIMEDGSLGIPWGSWTQGGVFRAGSQFGQSNPIPYIVGVGVTNNHELANNLVYSGAIQHMNPAAWVAKGMSWLQTTMEGHPEYFSDMFYSGLVTSSQFTQSQERGLELLSATESLLGGVYLASSLTDSRPNSVVNIKWLDAAKREIKDWAYGAFYKKSETYSQETIDDKVHVLENNKLDKAQAGEIYVSQNELSRKPYIQAVNSFPLLMQKVSKSEFSQMPSIPTDCVLFVLQK